jgi:hypothetical protein
MENSLNLQNCIKNNGLLIIDGNAYTSDYALLESGASNKFTFYSGPVLSNGEPSFDENDWYEVDMENVDLATISKFISFFTYK